MNTFLRMGIFSLALFLSQICFCMNQQALVVTDSAKTFTCFPQLFLHVQDKVFACSGNKNNLQKVDVTRYKRWSIKAPGVYAIAHLDPFWINDTNDHAGKILFGAAYFKYYDVVENIFKNIDARSQWHHFRDTFADGYSPDKHGVLGLYRIARHNEDAKMLALLDKYCCCDCGASEKGLMPTELMISSYIGNSDRIRTLLEDKTIMHDVESLRASLNEAIEQQDIESATVLLEYAVVQNCITDVMKEWFLAITAQRYENTNVLRFLLQNKYFHVSAADCDALFKRRSVRSEAEVILRKYMAEK